VLAVHEDVIKNRRAEVQALVDGIAKSGKWLDTNMANRMDAAQFVSKFYYNQHPRLLEYVLSKPPDRVIYSKLKPLRANFEEIEVLAKEAGILQGHGAFRRLRRRLVRTGDDAVQPHAYVPLSNEPADRAAGARGDATAKVTAARKRRRGASKVAWLWPAGGVGGSVLLGWHAAVRISGSDLFPTPCEVGRGIVELAQQGLLLKYVVASLFRVSWGFALAVLVGVPFGLLLGWYARGFQAFNPMIQIFRPDLADRVDSGRDPVVRRYGCGADFSSSFWRAFSRSRSLLSPRCRTCSPSTCGRRRTSG
jgi:hypothetical protein